MPDPSAPPISGDPRFFGRRRGKTLRASPQALLTQRLPALAVAQPAPGVSLDPAGLFQPPPARVWLEIGFGGGEHLAWQAREHPEIGLLGAEVFLNGIASLLGHIDRAGLTNVRIFAEDVRRLLPRLQPSSLDRVFLLFPDPWPKSRHADRRFVNDANLDQLARLMADGALLRIASDDPGYQDWVRQVMASRADFTDISLDVAAKPEDWPATRYESKARAAGRRPQFFSFRRCAALSADRAPPAPDAASARRD